MRADLSDKIVFIIESGRLFHNVGTEKEKACSPYVTEFTGGTVKSSLENERVSGATFRVRQYPLFYPFSYKFSHSSRVVWMRHKSP